MPDPIPFVLQHPRITVDAEGTTPINIECSANEVHTNVEQEDSTIETFCATYTSYKPEVWDITLNALQSFGADGLWNKVRPLVGTVTDYELLPDRDQPVSESNPLMKGRATVKAFPFLDGAVGEAQEFDLVLACQGIPEFLETPPAAMAASSSSTPSSE